MKRLFYSSAILMAFLAAGCGGSDKKDKVADDSAKLAPTSDEDKPNADYKPAFENQHRAPAAKTTIALTVDKLDTGIGRPWAIIPFPGDKLLVTDRGGFMTIRDAATGKQLTKITGFPKVNDGGQGGLLDVALDPDFAQNKTLYWAFSEKKDTGNLTAVGKGQLSPDEKTILNPTVIFRATPYLNSENHYGGRLAFDKDGNLFVSVGEKAVLEGRKQAQWLNSGLGKVFKITKDGKPSPGNPFINQKDAMPEIYSYGHRNPQGLTINPATGDLWEAEFGPKGGDEVNLIKPGKNYGWPTITYGIEYDGRKIGDSIQQKEGMEQPAYYWDPVVSPSGISFYSSDSIPEWKGNLFLGGLSSMRLVRLVIENNKVVGEERMLGDLKQRFRDVTEFKGKLYVITDEGNLYRISKK